MKRNIVSSDHLIVLDLEEQQIKPVAICELNFSLKYYLYSNII